MVAPLGLYMLRYIRVWPRLFRGKLMTFIDRITWAVDYYLWDKQSRRFPEDSLMWSNGRPKTGMSS
jgi:hypothetical protein